MTRVDTWLFYAAIFAPGVVAAVAAAHGHADGAAAICGMVALGALPVVPVGGSDLHDPRSVERTVLRIGAVYLIAAAILCGKMLFT